MNESQDIEELPCSDTELRDGLAFLSSNSPAFQRYQRELIQFIGDNLASANLLIGASIKDEAHLNQVVSTAHLVMLRSINKSIFKKLRGEVE